MKLKLGAHHPHILKRTKRLTAVRHPKRTASRRRGGT
jgi:hypothetical protein